MPKSSSHRPTPARTTRAPTTSRRTTGQHDSRRFRPNQYDNPNGPLSHYYTTGPEIWEATDHKVTHFVAGIGAGGTISGTGKYLKEASNGAVKVIGSDPEGSIYSASSRDEVHQYDIEGVGEDFYPKAFDRNITETSCAYPTPKPLK